MRAYATNQLEMNVILSDEEMTCLGTGDTLTGLVHIRDQDGKIAHTKQLKVLRDDFDSDSSAGVDYIPEDAENFEEILGYLIKITDRGYDKLLGGKQAGCRFGGCGRVNVGVGEKSFATPF